MFSMIGGDLGDQKIFFLLSPVMIQRRRRSFAFFASAHPSTTAFVSSSVVNSMFDPPSSQAPANQLS